MSTKEEYNMDRDDAESCTTYYSAVLRAPKIAAQHCPSCDEKEESRLCIKCRDTYVCYQCAPRGACVECVITCETCAAFGLRGDFLENICENCENMLSEIDGEIIDTDGSPHKNLVELLTSEMTGKIVTNDVVCDELRDYLNEQGVIVEVSILM
jgi:hypothetical protein